MKRHKVTPASNRPRGPTDHQRRARIARAALEIITESGIGALTHRAVAKQAGVPLGSTTYHYAGRDALLLTVIQESVAAYRHRVEAWAANLKSGSLIRDLAEFLRAMTATNIARNRLRVEYELYLVAIRSEYLRPVSASWDAILRDALQAVVGETKARAIYAMVNGLLVEAVIHDRVLDKAEVVVLLSHLDRA
jgi:TetR/AcrR family transcriptional regulator, regulator of biofilm formation and stress response